MKKVNFITSLSPQKQYEIRRWFWMTILLLIGGIIIGIGFLFVPFFNYISLKKEVYALREKTKMYEEKAKARSALISECNRLRERINKINTYSQVPKNPHSYVQAIIQASSNDVKCEFIRFNKKNCETIICCSKPEHATAFIEHLLTSGLFSHIKLVSLQHDIQTKQLRCILKGNIV